MAEGEETLRIKLQQIGFQQGLPFVVLHPGASWIGKRWREERFAELADKIQSEYGMQVVLTGSKIEQAIGLKVVSLMHSQPVNLIGLVGIREILSLYAKATLWVGNDTGTMHVATALGCPVIVLWGPTKLEKFGPCGTNAQVIVGQGNPGPESGERVQMDLIQVSEVWETVKMKLEQEMHYAHV
jgi:ADP-heptose:LPS heptosyltransferase